jgi:hypothetical protein
LTGADATSATNVAKTIRSPAMLHRISLPFDRSSSFLRDFADANLKVRRPAQCWLQTTNDITGRTGSIAG